MKSIYTLIIDLQSQLEKKDGWFSEDVSTRVGTAISGQLRTHFNAGRYSPGRATLRMSGMGPKCPKALWFSIHHPELAEPLPSWAEFKYAFGYVIESMAIELAKAAGHEVTGEQDELRLDGIVGHRDCVIDGCVVDVKSCSSIQFSKYKNGSVAQSDNFGYLDQLDAYVVASRDDPFVRVKDRGYILAIDKTLGHMTLYEHQIREQSIRERIGYYKSIVALPSPPPCECKTRPEGASGNIRLDTVASYNPYKFCCNPFLRTFIYAGGAPTYLTKVVRKPDVKEVDKLGKTVYH